MVELERDEGGQTPEGALAHLGQVVVTEGPYLCNVYTISGIIPAFGPDM